MINRTSYKSWLGSGLLIIFLQTNAIKGAVSPPKVSGLISTTNNTVEATVHEDIQPSTTNTKNTFTEGYIPKPLNSTSQDPKLSYVDNSDLVLPKLKNFLSSGNYSDIFETSIDMLEVILHTNATHDASENGNVSLQSASTSKPSETPKPQASAEPDGLPGQFLYISNPESHTEQNCYIIKVKDSVKKLTFEKLSELFGALEAKVQKTYLHGFRGYSICFHENVLPLSIMREIPSIEFIERDNVIKSSQIQEHAPWGLARLSSPNVHSNSFGFDATGEGVSVYVIDSGYQDTKELSGRASLAYSAFPDSPPDCSGHGTEVASVVAGTNVGVAKKANVLVAQVLNCQGDGRNSDLIDAISWVIETHQKPALINMSLGGDKSPSLDKAVKAAIAAGIPVIVSAGNSNTNACTQSPAAVAEAITVAASAQGNTRAKFSNYGPCVDIFAPGVDILTSATPEKSRNGWAFVSGTSFSAPFVAGVAALVLEKNPKLTPFELADQIAKLAASSVLSQSTLKGSPNLLLQAPTALSKIPILVKLGDPSGIPALGYHTSSIVSVELVLVIVAIIMAVLAIASMAAALYRRKKNRKSKLEPALSESDLKRSILYSRRPSVFL